MPLASSPSFESRLLLCVGLLLWILAGLACIWEVLALQPPDSPMHLGVLSGPVAQLRSFAFALGAGCALVGLAWPWLYPEAGGRGVALALSGGAMLHTLALFYAASRGLLAVQLLDPRPDARFVLYTRALAHIVTLIAITSLLARALRGRVRA